MCCLLDGAGHLGELPVSGSSSAAGAAGGGGGGDGGDLEVRVIPGSATATVRVQH